MKKFLSLILAVLMVLSVAVTVGAASTSKQSGIGNPVGAATTISTPHGTAPARSARDSRSSSYTTARLDTSASNPAAARPAHSTQTSTRIPQRKSTVPPARSLPAFTM